MRFRTTTCTPSGIKKKAEGQSSEGTFEVVEIIKHKTIFFHRPELVRDDEVEV